MSDDNKVTTNDLLTALLEAYTNLSYPHPCGICYCVWDAVALVQEKKQLLLSPVEFEKATAYLRILLNRHKPNKPEGVFTLYWWPVYDREVRKKFINNLITKYSNEPIQ